MHSTFSRQSRKRFRDIPFALGGFTLLLALVLFPTGCGTTIPDQGVKFNSENVSKIEIGKTTEAEVLQLIGQPTMRTRQADGTTTFLFQHVRTSTSYGYFSPLTGKTPDVQQNSQSLVVIIGKDGKVKDFTQSSTH